MKPKIRLLTLLFIVLAAGTIAAQVEFTRAAPTLDVIVGKGTPEECTEAKFDLALNAVQASGGGTISFNCGGPATIIFKSQKVVDTQLLVIIGGEQITLNGANNTRLFHVKLGTLELRDITLSNGNSKDGFGGAILANNNTSVYVINSTIKNSRTYEDFAGGAILSFDKSTPDTSVFPAVYIEDSIIENNESTYAAINTVGWLEVHNSVIENNNGGGLSVGGPTEIVDTDFLLNEGIRGGAILATKTATIDLRGGSVIGNKATDNYGGGAILNRGFITLTDVLLKYNISYDDGGALDNEGTAVLTGITLTDNDADEDGGAIKNIGSLTLQNSTLAGNYADLNGGAIFNSGSLVIQDSTLNGNRASYYGGAIHNRETLTLQNSTLSSNDANGLEDGKKAGGAIDNSGTASISNSTLVDNVGNADTSIHHHKSGKLNITNTIVVSRGGDNCSGEAARNINFSLFDDSSCQFDFGTGNLYELPFIGDLADNGGPTLTHMIASFSPAVDAGQCSVGADQRGVARPQGLECDIGAVERRPVEGAFSVYLSAMIK